MVKKASLRLLIIFIVSFIVGFIISKQKERCLINTEYVYSDSISFHEKEIPEGVLPVFICPQDSDITNFIERRDRPAYGELMIRFLYVANSDEGVVYSLLASNKFHISYAESYVFWSLTREDLGEFINGIAHKHLMRGVKLKDLDSMNAYESK